MSVIIIGGGDGARHAIADLETASLTMTDAQRHAAEELLEHFVKAVRAFISTPTPQVRDR
ncbi:MAG TPA: hypothetical protein VJV74_05405 [Terriglobia bacterium]|nr:hypothetical protein [Terriglobia bacterium]